MLDCIVLAGGGKGDLAEQEGVACKALIRINDREMVRYVLTALCALPQIGRIIVVGPREELLFLQEHFPVEIVAEQGSILQNLVAANRCLNSGRHILISSADIPLLSLEALEHLLSKCRPFTYDFYYPISSKERSESSFPGAKRTYVTMQEGTFTGGNVFLVNSAVIEDSAPLLERFLENRKSPLKMVSLLGAGFVLNYLRKNLTIAGLEERISSLLNLKARAVIIDYPEIGFDVDKPSDLDLVRGIMSK
ncbi:MAG: NTP transferase domain-containing protein [Bacillota bacterium]